MTINGVELLFGSWQEVLEGIAVDHVITDPPFSARTHKGQTARRRPVAGSSENYVSTKGLGYDAMTPEMIDEFVASWSPRTRGWMCPFTSHDLIPDYERALREAGRYVFAPLACVIPGMNVRLAGDGPSNWALPLVVSRPIGMPLWGTLPGAYVCKRERLPKGQTRVPGQKPLELMRKIVRDYSHAGDLVCDPYAGSGTTMIACVLEGRRFVGAEYDRERYELAQDRVQRELSIAHLPVGAAC
jgi:site-specific DNA-methyltransferase (adenine-specific)